jgi:hypothetical protein
MAKRQITIRDIDIPNLARRFWAKVYKTEGCWFWIAGKNQHGYGKISRTRKAGPERAHRISWELNYGPIPDGLCVLHKCDNPPCVRPEHLFLGTKRDNHDDMVKKGRMVPPPIHIGDAHPLRRDPSVRSYGEKNGNSRYTAEQALAVWQMNGSYTQIQLATGLNRNFIASVRSGKAWAHVTKNQQRGFSTGPRI